MKIYRITFTVILTSMIYIWPGSLHAQGTTNVIQLIRDSQTAMAENSIEQAEVLSKKAVTLDPAYPPAWRQYGLTLLSAGRKEEAVAAFKRTIEMDAGDATALRGMAIACWQTDKHNEAIRALSAYLRLKPEDVSVWRDMATWLTELNRGDQAIAALERVVELEPDNASSWRELGSWQLRLKHYEPAVTALNRTVKLKPEDISAWRDLAAGLTHLQRYEEAVTALKTVIKSQPDEASTWHELGILHSHLKQYDLAIAAYKQSVTIDPQRVSAWRDLAVQLSRQERYDEATRTFEKVVELNPEDASSWRELALLYQRNNKLDNAVTAFEKCLQIKPDDAASRRDLGWILWKQGKHDQALAELTKAVENGVESKDQVVFQVVALLCEEGSSEKALEFLRRTAPEQSPSSMGLAFARAGRLIAARPVLEYAWNIGEKTVDVGLYSAYARASGGEYTDVGIYLEPLLKTSTGCTEEHADIALKTLLFCSALPEAPQLAEKLEKLLNNDAVYRGRITDILEKAAESLRNNSKPEGALSMYRRVIARDPQRLSWIWIVLLSERVEGKTPFIWMENYRKQLSDPALLAGVNGLYSDRKGEGEKAVQELHRSLQLKPEQIILRQELFNSLLRQGRVDEARTETEWFVDKIRQGDKTLRPQLAEMLTALGDFTDALAVWKVLYSENPDSTYYGTGTASVYYELDQPDKAIEILRTLEKVSKEHRIYELLSEIHSALDQRGPAAQWAAEGLATDPTPALLRSYAENLEILGTNNTAALDSARKFLEEDPGNVSVTLMAGRLMEALGQTNNVYEFHNDLLERNQVFTPSLRILSRISTSTGKPDDTVEYSRRRMAVLPENYLAREEYANALTGQDKMRDSLKMLRELTDIKPAETLPVLIYTSPAGLPYDGRNSVKQITAHIKCLADNGYTFVNSFKNMPDVKDPRYVMLVLIDPEPKVIEALDPILRQYNACVVYAGNAGVPNLTLSGSPIPGRAGTILAGERWKLASGGPPELNRNAVNASGVLGNPLTHPLADNNALESRNAFSARVDKEFDKATLAIKNDDERILVYPAGDFGQLSLDTGSDNLDVLYSSTAGHFTHAIYYDPCGFHVMADPSNPLRIPARTIPWNWDESMLVEYLTSSHPLILSWIELGKALYWNGQYEAAYNAFSHAEKAGADPLTLHFYRGVNAYLQGDLHTALKDLEAAREIDPESEKIRIALERLEKRRRPTATAYLYGWIDNEDRDYFKFGAYGDAFITDRLMLGALADRNRWSTEGNGDEYGTRMGIRALAFLYPQIWLSGSLWFLNMDDVENHWGGQAALRLPNPLASGYITPTYTREEIETVEALRKGIDADTYALRTYTRLIDIFDLYADGLFITRTDHNDTYMVDGRLLYRLSNWPYTGIGWRFRFGDSDRDPPEYWAPEGLQQHQLHITVRGAWNRLSGFVSAEAGIARERDKEWDFVWGARADGSYMLTDVFSLGAMVRWAESSSYQRLQGRIGITGRF